MSFDSFRVISGVPQGSVLGPVLFTLHMRPLGNTTIGITYLRHADDTLFHVSNTHQSGMSPETKDLDDLEHFAPTFR